VSNHPPTRSLTGQHLTLMRRPFAEPTRTLKSLAPEMGQGGHSSGIKGRATRAEAVNRRSASGVAAGVDLSGVSSLACGCEARWL
jgi:hypothetical protein